MNQRDLVLSGTAQRWFRIALLASLFWPAQVSAQGATPKDLVIDQYGAPRPFRIGTGFALAYEVHVTNINRYPVRIEAVEILAAPSLTPIYSLSGDSLNSDVNWQPGMAAGETKVQMLGSAMRAVLFLYLPISAEQEIPGSIVHRVRFSWEVGAGSRAEMVTDTKALRTFSEGAPLLIGSPVSPGQWFIGNCVDFGRQGHRGSIHSAHGTPVAPQRFAIDFMKLSNDGRLTTVEDPEKNDEFFTYGAELLAVADGRVVGILDEVPENEPFSREMPIVRTPENAPGNHIILDIGSGHFAFYAHLIPTSLRVRIGDTVKKGDVIGLLGNSGRSDAPHLHFHIADSESLYSSDGLPFAFEEFEYVGDRDLLEMVNNSNTEWTSSSLDSEIRSKEMPRSNTVIRFRD